MLKMPSFSIPVVVVVLIAAIGQEQLQFIAAQYQYPPQPPAAGQAGQPPAAGLPYAGSLYNCGETNYASDIAGNKWDYVFDCKLGAICVKGACVFCPPGYPQAYNPYNKTPFILQCNIVNSIVKRCKGGVVRPAGASDGCDLNYNLASQCGFAFTRNTDAQTYYWNCQNGGNCVDGKCSNGGPVIISRCNKPNLYVTSGQCQNGQTGTECNGVQCMPMNYQFTGGES